MKWIKSKAVWIGLLVVGVFIFFKDIIFDLLLSSARKVTEETKQKAQKHRLKAEQAKARAENNIKRSKEIEEEIKKIDADLDWHKQRNN